MFVFRHASNLNPVFFLNIFIDFDVSGVQGVHSVLSTARDPVVLSGLGFEVVGFETVPFQGFKGLTLVMNGLPRLREANAPDTSRTREPTRLVFNVHDARLAHADGV